MGQVFLLMPLVIFADPGGGGFPRVRDANSHQRTIFSLSRQTSLLPCVPAHHQVLDRTTPAPEVGEISSVRTILQGKN
jgi:hypothetical protein